jgi:hypothetical protein
MNTYYGYIEFKEIRDFRNLFQVNKMQEKWKQFNYLILTRDKLIFNAICRYYSIPHPPIYFIYDGATKKLYDKFNNPLDFYEINNIKKDLIIKETCGDSGKGCYFIQVNNKAGLLDQFKEIQRNLTGKYLLQEKVRQNSEIDKLNSSSLNTLRLITLKKNNKSIVPILGMFRIGREGSSVDNWAQGGVVVAVDIHNGVLEKYGHLKFMSYEDLEYHPDSKVKFEGFKIPYFQEAVEYARKLHMSMEVHSMGWDIGFTENGPVFLEGGDDWEISHQQCRRLGLKPVLEKLFKE